MNTEEVTVDQIWKYSNLGLAGSPTKIAKASDKVRKGAGEKVVPESPEEAVKYIVGKLAEKHVIW